MRDDMFKVIVERPRWGSRWIESPKLDRDKYHDRGSIGLRRHAKEQKCPHKGFNENLAPLARFLRSRCDLLGRAGDGRSVAPLVPSRRSFRAAPRSQTDLRRIDDRHFLWRRRGCWFLVTFDFPPHLREAELLALLVAGGRAAPQAYCQGNLPMGEWRRNKPVGDPPAWQVTVLRKPGKRELRRFGLAGGRDD